MIFILSIFTGMIFILVKTINMLLSKEVGIYKGNLVNHITGLCLATFFLLILGLKIDVSTFNINGHGIFPWLGGVMGATFVTLSNHTFSKTKVLISTLLILVGQTLASIVIDWIIMGKMISLSSVLGILLIISAVFLYNKPSKFQKSNY
jgi:uncharacterized membrane protein YdcZ (DUF606 family)